MPFRVNEVPNSSRWQIFLTDPNNVLIELNFDVANEKPPRWPSARACRTLGCLRHLLGNEARQREGRDVHLGVQYLVGKRPARA